MTDESTGQKSATVSGQAAPVAARITADADPENPPDEFADALDADEFVIYGKASIEQFDEDDPPEILDMDALEAALDRFFTSEKAPGIISLAHEDIPIGQPVREHEIEEDAVIEVGGDTYEFSAGDTITTHVEDADGDNQPELWLVADLANDTDIARKARLGVLTGELDGFSVTIGRKQDQPEGEGRRVTELDLFAVTVGPDDAIRNKGSEFDLAEFKAAVAQYEAPTARGDDATSGSRVAEQLAAVITDTTMSQSTDTDDTNGLLKRMGDALKQKAEEAEEQSDDNTSDESGQKAEEDGGEDVTGDLIAALADEMDLEEDALKAAIQSAAQNADDMPPSDEDDEDDEEEDEEDGQKAEEDGGEDDSVTINFAEKLDEHGVVTEDDLDQKLDDRLESARESIVDDVGEKLAEANEEAVAEIAQKMETAGTPTPAGGSMQDSEDFESHLEDIADGEDW